jgi:hypothetical protein
MNADQDRAPFYAALIHAGESLTAAPFTLAALPGGPVKEAIHEAAATAAVHVAERALRVRRPNRRPAVRVLAALGFAGYVAARKAGTR